MVYKCCKCVCSISFSTFLKVFKCYKCVCSISFSTFLMVFKCYKCVCSISFSTFLSFLVIGCFYTRVLEFEGALHRKRIFLKLKKIQGLFKDLHRNSRTFQGKMEFKDFSRTPPKIQGLFKTVRTLLHKSRIKISTTLKCN